MKLFVKYIMQYKWTALLFGAFTCIFAVVFSLYDIQTEAVLYSFVLCVTVAIIVLFIHFWSFRKKYVERQRLIDHIMQIAEDLPEADSPLERQYTEIIEKLWSVCHENQNRYRQERSESIDYYTAWVHQIKTPISVMQMILQSEDTEEYRALSAELFKIEQYVEMVLCWFRLSSTTNDFVIETISLDEIIRAAVRKYAPQFIRKKIKVIYDGTECTPLSDEKWLLFILEQLLSNAVKYTENGSVTILVTGNILKIKDTGMGIAAEDLPRIFEKGYTGYNGREDKKSTGLGLYLCRKAAEKLSHKIYAESEVGKGSTFCIDLNTDRLEVE